MIHLIVLTSVVDDKECTFVIENIQCICAGEFYIEVYHTRRCTFVDGVKVKESVMEITKRINQIIYGKD